MPDIVNPFYTSVARGVEDTARKNNYTLIICNYDDDTEKELEYFRTALSLKVDGCLLIPSGDKTKKSMLLLADHNCPLVLIDRHPSAYVGDYVAGDSFNGAADLVDYSSRAGIAESPSLMVPPVSRPPATGFLVTNSDLNRMR
jgi:LacI family transcriptional regulator